MRTDVAAVIFDLDGTLLDPRGSFDRFVRNQWRRFAQCQRAGQEQYVQALIALDRDGYASRQALFATVVSRFGLPRRVVSRSTGHGSRRGRRHHRRTGRSTAVAGNPLADAPPESVTASFLPRLLVIPTHQIGVSRDRCAGLLVAFGHGHSLA
jgi:hypothetical protein